MPFLLVVALVLAMLSPATAAAPVPFQIGKPKLNKQKGTAVLRVEVPEKGKVSISTEKQLSYTEIFFQGAGSGKLPIRARQGKPINQLKANGKLTVKPTITFAPQGPPSPSGGPNSKVITVTLRFTR
jgi:hypothetical protein